MWGIPRTGGGGAQGRRWGEGFGVWENFISPKTTPALGRALNLERENGCSGLWSQSLQAVSQILQFCIKTVKNGHFGVGFQAPAHPVLVNQRPTLSSQSCPCQSSGFWNELWDGSPGSPTAPRADELLEKTNQTHPHTPSSGLPAPSFVVGFIISPGESSKTARFNRRLERKVSAAPNGPVGSFPSQLQILS